MRTFLLAAGYTNLALAVTCSPWPLANALAALACFVVAQAAADIDSKRVLLTN